METKDLLQKVRSIEIKSRKLTNQIFAGEYHSSFKGKGMTFSEVREYNYGDPIKSIDWNVTARFNHPYVKIFEEERELTVMLVIDVSASKSFGTGIKFKHGTTIKSNNKFVAKVKQTNYNSINHQPTIPINFSTTNILLENITNYSNINKSLNVNNKNNEIFPNPTNGIINYNFEEKPNKINICNANGKVLISEIIVNKLGNIDISNLPTGLYIVNVYFDNYVKSYKILIL